MASLGEKALQAQGIVYSSHEYDFRQKGAEAAAKALNLDLAAVLKTLVLKHSGGGFLFLLVPGEISVSMRKMSRALGVKSVEMASERDAERLTGYRVGGIGPFGSRTRLPVFLELQAVEQDRVFFNGGRRGLLLGLEVETLMNALAAELVDVAT